MSDIISKQSYFRKDNGEEVPIVTMSAKELVDAVNFCKKYCRTTIKKNKYLEYQLSYNAKKISSFNELINDMTMLIKTKPLEKVEPGDKFVIQGDDNLYQLSEGDDRTELDKLIEQKKVYAYVDN